MCEGKRPRQRNSRGEGSRLREEVLQAAMRLLDRGPASEVSLRMVAREAGVAAPSLYAHFRDAQALLAEIVRACWDDLGDAMAQAAETAGTQDADPLAVFRARLSAYVLYAMERPARYQLLFALPPIDWEERDTLHGLLRPAYRQVLDSVEALAAAGWSLPADDASTASLFILSVAHGRIALAHLAPQRAGNAPAAVGQFVQAILSRSFSPPIASAAD